MKNDVILLEDVQAFLKAAEANGIPEDEARQYLHEKSASEVNRHSPFSSIQRAISPDLIAHGLRDLIYPGDREKRRILNTLHARYILHEKDEEVNREPESVEDRFRRFEESCGHPCDRLSVVTLDKVKEFAKTIRDPLERVDFIDVILNLSNDGLDDDIQNAKKSIDGRALNQRNQNDLLTPLRAERTRLLSERFNTRVLISTLRGMRRVQDQLILLTNEEELFLDYHSNMHPSSFSNAAQQYNRTLKHEMERAERRRLAGLSELEPRPFANTSNRVVAAESIQARVLRDLSKDTRFEKVRSFLEGLERHEGKLVWPDVRRGLVPESERWARNHLPLLVLHLVEEDAITSVPKGSSDIHQLVVVPCFTWNNQHEITNSESQSKLDSVKDKFPPNIDLTAKHNKPVWHLISSFSSHYRNS